MKKIICSLVMLLLVVASGCASSRTNLSYNASRGDIKKLSTPVTVAVIPVTDVREGMMTYPKQVIVQKSYGGDVTYEINDRTVDEVFTEALTQELKALGAGVVVTTDINGPLDKDSAGKVKKVLESKYPDVKVAIGARVTNFIAESQRSVVTTKVNLKASIQLNILDVKTGDLVWSDTRSDWDNTVVSADRDYLIEQLNQALASLMHKSVRDNMSLRDLLVKVSSR